MPVGLSVIIDGRLDVARARQVAIFADRLGLAGVWLRRPWWPLDGVPAMSEEDAGGLLAWLAGRDRVQAGLVADAGKADAAWPGRLAAMAGPGPGGTPRAPRLSIALSGEPADVGRWQRLIGQQPALGATRLALPAGAALPPGPGIAPASAIFIPCSPGRDLDGEVATAARAAAGTPVVAEVTVSVGRTDAEARARADADGLFTVAGHPARQGLFGTLEECQAAAARLAHAGVTELACYLPLASDLHDVLAQLRSIAVGASVMRPGDVPSAAPPPPTGWGGRRATA
jgi:hypothetical protein